MLPSKLQKGQAFKPNVVDRINQIIDYLKTQKIIGDQKTIQVSQGTSGIMLSVPQKGSNPITKGGSGQGLVTPSEGVYMLVCINGNITWLQIPNDNNYVLTSKEISSSSSSDSSSSLSSESSITSDMPQYYLEWIQADTCDIECDQDLVIENESGGGEFNGQ